MRFQCWMACRWMHVFKIGLKVSKTWNLLHVVNCAAESLNMVSMRKATLKSHVRESSFNMTRGDEDIDTGLWKFLDTRKGTLKICILQNQQEEGRLLKNWTASKGAAKLSSFEFIYLHSPLFILKELSLRSWC